MKAGSFLPALGLLNGWDAIDEADTLSTSPNCRRQRHGLVKLVLCVTLSFDKGSIISVDHSWFYFHESRLSHRLTAFSRLVVHGAFSASALFPSQGSSQSERILIWALPDDPALTLQAQEMLRHTIHRLLQSDQTKTEEHQSRLCSRSCASRLH